MSVILHNLRLYGVVTQSGAFIDIKKAYFTFTVLYTHSTSIGILKS